MGTGTAATVSCLGDDGAGTDIIAFGDEGLGEVAIADGEVAVTEGDIKSRTFVSAYFVDHRLIKNAHFRYTVALGEIAADSARGIDQ